MATAVAIPNQPVPGPVPPVPKTPAAPRNSTGAKSAGTIATKPSQVIFNQSGRPSTGPGMLIAGIQGQVIVPQKLSVTRLPAIVNRMQRETLSSRSKRRRFYKSDTYVDYKFYTWRNLPLWSDFQSHLWRDDGSVKTSFRKWRRCILISNFICWMLSSSKYIIICILEYRLSWHEQG